MVVCTNYQVNDKVFFLHQYRLMYGKIVKISITISKGEERIIYGIIDIGSTFQYDVDQQYIADNGLLLERFFYEYANKTKNEDDKYEKYKEELSSQQTSTEELSSQQTSTEELSSQQTSTEELPF